MRLTLTPKTPIGEGTWLKPALTSLVLEVGKDGVPAAGVLRLDQGEIKDDGKVAFQFADAKGKKRIARIENTLSSANLTITPSLAFTFGADKSGPQLPALIEFRVPGEGLSGTMAGMDMVSFLVFRNCKVKKGK